MEKILSEDYCSPEVSKLLKEKGFDEICTLAYEELNQLKVMMNWRVASGYLPCPTHQMATKWLREVHKLFIVIEPEYFEAGRVIAYDFSVWCGDNYKHYFKDYPTFEEAVEAALKHALENLI